MGRAKDEMMRWDELLEEGRVIAVAAGVLAQCEIHPECVWEVALTTDDAYKLGNHRFDKGLLHNHFKTRKELMDAIKAAIDDSGLEGCPSCANALRD